MAIYNQSWLHTILYDLEGSVVNEDIWQSICYHYGITQTVNGSWIQALCDFFGSEHDLGESWIQSLAEDFGATAPVNGSWIQALALRIQANADIIDIFMDRVAADGGVFEAEACLEIILNEFYAIP
jgi:hypothetical protein